MANVEIQTNVDNIYLHKLELEINNSVYEWNKFQEVPLLIENTSGEFIKSIESFLSLMKVVNGQIMKLKKDLEIEEFQKCEMSDKFEQIITELESACDAEVEKLKLSNELFKQEIMLIKCEREEQENNLNELRNQLFALQLESTRSCPSGLEKDNFIDVSVETNDNSLLWISNFNDALKQTISEKEDQITELMKQLNESINKLKEFQFKEESSSLTIQELNSKILLISEELQMKDKNMQDNLDIINEFEVICIEKDNRINSLEKELADINSQLEQYISAVCSMQARLEASKPNVELMLNKIDSRTNNIELLNLIDQLEKDYAEELEQSEMSKSKLEIKLNKAVQVIHKLKKQLKQSHSNVLKLNEEIKSLKSLYQFNIDKEDVNISRDISNIGTTFVDVSTQMDLHEEENINYKGIIENLHINNFMLLRELDNFRNNDRNFRGSSLPPTITGSVNTGRNFIYGSERSVSPVSQLSSNSFEGDSVNLNQLKDLQRKIHRTTQQLNQMRVERNRIHQEYTKIRQLKEEGDQKISELLKHMDTNINQDNILHEKDQLIEMNNKYSTKIVELEAEIEMITVRNSILETKCKKMEWKLNNQRRKYDQLFLKVDEKEQELDRSSDELRRVLSNSEKDRLDWLKEKKELKLLNKTKDAKICEFRKKLSNKSKEEVGMKSNNKEETVDDSTENDYLLEIEQLKQQISQLKLENKQFIAQQREEMIKYKGQLEELIDDNCQLKRKLALDQKDSKINFSDNRSTIRSSNSLIGIIDEVNETSDLMWNNTDLNAILAKVVLEKENLINLMSEIEKQLNDEKQKSFEYQQAIIQLKNLSNQEMNLFNKVDQSSQCEYIENNSNLFSQFNQHKESIDKYIQFSIHDFECNSVDKAIQTSNKRLIDQFTQTCENYEAQIIKKYKTESHRNVIDKIVQTKNNFDQQIVSDYRLNLFQRLSIENFPSIDCANCSFNKNVEIQTEADNKLQKLICSVENVSHSIGIQTNDDELTKTLYKEISLKNKIIEDSSHQILVLNDKLGQLDYEFTEAGKKIALFEYQNLDYQEMISKLELDNIELEKKYKQYIRELNLEFENYKELNEKENKLIDQSVNETHNQVNEMQMADGWDMEWEYEKIATESNFPDNSVVEPVEDKFLKSPENILSKFLIELDLILNLDSNDILIPQIKQLMLTYKSVENIEEFDKQESINSSVNILNLVAILREEIAQLKQLLNEKNNEIGQLKCLRNQLQAELLESGQQIKDSNMEFLNLKENIQAVNVESNIFKQKTEDLEMRFKKFVNFVKMLSLDLRRLRDSSPLINESLSDSNVIDEQNVNKVTQSMELELHKLLQQMYDNDIKLQKSINQGLDEFCSSGFIPDRTERIEQLSCAIQRLQLNHKSHISLDDDNSNLHSKDSTNDYLHNTNDHEECQNLLTELSELLEKKQKEIEELRSRLFLATDQLIHFRTFFSDPDYKLKEEYLPINKTINHTEKSYQEKLENDTSKLHTKLLFESEDDERFSDSDDQLMVSKSGSTVIKVERTMKFQTPCTKELFTRICGRTRYKKFINNIKSAVLASRRSVFFFRSQPRFNIKTLLTMYIMFIHIFLFRCIFL